MIQVTLDIYNEDFTEVVQTLIYRGKWTAQPAIVELTPRILDLMKHLEIGINNFIIREGASRRDKVKS